MNEDKPYFVNADYGVWNAELFSTLNSAIHILMGGMVFPPPLARLRLRASELTGYGTLE